MKRLKINHLSVSSRQVSLIFMSQITRILYYILASVSRWTGMRAEQQNSSSQLIHDFGQRQTYTLLLLESV